MRRVLCGCGRRLRLSFPRLALRDVCVQRRQKRTFKTKTKNTLPLPPPTLPRRSLPRRRPAPRAGPSTRARASCLAGSLACASCLREEASERELRCAHGPWVAGVRTIMSRPARWGVCGRRAGVLGCSTALIHSTAPGLAQRARPAHAARQPSGRPARRQGQGKKASCRAPTVRSNAATSRFSRVGRRQELSRRRLPPERGAHLVGSRRCTL